ncbi:hypothetical protein TYRP_002575 [Tyrophagus putrescentiae]|nr:hypothetical protein TYRP_002575 [Tyrophagus putrescentiae]
MPSSSLNSHANAVGSSSSSQLHFWSPFGIPLTLSASLAWKAIQVTGGMNGEELVNKNKPW